MPVHLVPCDGVRAATLAAQPWRITMRNYLWQQKPWQAFKNFAIIFSFITNVVLLLLLLLAAPLIIPIVDAIVDPLVGGLATSFVQMEDADITRTIQVEDELPVQFTLPVSTVTDVILVEPVPLTVPATFNLPAGGGTIRGSVNLELPQGLTLPMQLDLTVPVSQTVPVNLAVGVDIPLNETELGTPFATLEGLFTPLDHFLQGLPDNNEELLRRVTAAQEQPDPVGTARKPK